MSCYVCLTSLDLKCYKNTDVHRAWIDKKLTLEKTEGTVTNEQSRDTGVDIRIIMIKRFFSGVHACVHEVDALTNFT
jgi:hypothetical protein